MSLQNTNGEILLAGAVAALTVDLLLYPLDTLKTRLQSREYATLFANNRRALFGGLYQGIGSVIVATLPSSGAFFIAYEGLKGAFAEEKQTFVPQPVVHMAASSVAELVACAIFAPAEIIKQNAQMVSSSSSSSSSTSATMATLQKFRANPSALWGGYVALIVRDLPFSAIQFPLYERFRTQLGHGNEKDLADTARVTALSSALASGVASVLTTPVDVVKTRVMLDTGAAVTTTALRPGWYATAHDIAVREGVRGLWRGGVLRCVWTMLGGGLYLGVYESGRVWLAQRREGVGGDF
ncbi:mitochondrial carrier [Exidia glandulosa HHB12029]|uniref:Mitochondrial carrier n=1 Tax=Exidia glandulosa HHB12029 TaxID=1314781 RepID=A0A165ZRT2_EXIGL|nr:mitochondrial carrier [Exidia glandulosa HHB12029]